MPSHRHQRVQELLKREISSILREEIPSESIGLVTVNDIGLSNNLQSAVVYVSVVGPPAKQAAALNWLRKNHARIQVRLGRSITLKYTPKLRFVLDESVERGNRVLAILAQLERTLPPE